MVDVEALGAWTVRAASGEGRDPLGLLAEQEAVRLPELVPLRHERMAANAFAYYRGAALPMAADLAGMPTTGIRVQCIGDAHVGNFGIFMSPARRLVFDVNDFDETLPGPWEWDLWRLVASVEVCGRVNGHSHKERKRAVLACASAYREAMGEFAAMTNLDVWYKRLVVEEALHDHKDELSGHETKAITKAIEKAQGKNSYRAVERLCEKVDGRLRVVSAPPELRPLSEVVGYEDADRLFTTLLRLYSSYVASLPLAQRHLIDQYHLQDLGQKVVGVGSVGMRAWIAVLSGRDLDDPLVLQIKEAGPSVLERYLGKSEFEHAGQRVVEGQRLVQSASDVLLGWTQVGDVNGLHGENCRDYYVRQLWDGKGSIELEGIGAGSLAKTGRMAAWALAHAHARTGDRRAIAEYVGGAGEAFDDAMLEFARAYADQNEVDYQAFIASMA